MYQIKKAHVFVLSFISAAIYGGCNVPSVDLTQITQTQTSPTPTPMPSRHFPPPRLFVADRGNDRIVELDDLNGKVRETYSLPSSGQPSGFAFDSTRRIYISDSVNSQIVRVDHLDGENQVVYGTEGTGVGQFDLPAGVALDSQNRIYVLDSGNNRVVRMDDVNGTNWISFGTAGSGIGQFSAPSAIALDPNGRVYVVDSGNHRITRFDDLSGTNWVSLGAAPAGGAGENEFQFPAAIALGISRDSVGAPTVSNILIADSGNNRIVLVNDLLGTGWTTFGTVGAGTSQFNAPSGVAFGQRGKIFVSDAGNSRLISVDGLTGDNWTVLGVAGVGNVQVNTPGEIVRHFIHRFSTGSIDSHTQAIE